MVPPLEGLTIGACSSDGDLTMALGYSLFRVMREEGAPIRPVPIPREVGPTLGLARGKDGEIVTLNGGALGSNLHRLDRAGSFGKAYSAGGRLSAP